MKLIKYIMLQSCLPVIFEGLNHDEFKILGKQITSAGFITFDAQGNVSTYGESLTLNMIPAKNDAQVIQNFFDKAKS